MNKNELDEAIIGDAIQGCIDMREGISVTSTMTGLCQTEIKYYKDLGVAIQVLQQKRNELYHARLHGGKGEK